jgi:haloacid dehalogenase superfamily, subfamily IA, variant 3 with third motif having DD or ED/haloacid dehalogenase superfamily, subfamily IA, variant 1 with third motif having Dx(3-4)D or Dx(3-4)E
MSRPAAVMLDMFGVIMKENRGNFPGYISARCTLPEARVYADRTEYNKYYRPASAGAESSEEFLRRFGFENAEETAREYVSDFVTFDSDFIIFAEHCAVNGIKLSLLSNDIGIFSRSIREVYGIEKYFYDSVVSAEVGLRKPDPAIFTLALNRLGLSASECVFVDDLPDNLEAAQKLGISTVQFRRPTALVDDSFTFVRTFPELWAELSAEITPAAEPELEWCANVIRESFATVADEFNLTRENCPAYVGFIPTERLHSDRERGARQFMLRHFGDEIIGFAELIERGDDFELSKLSVLPEYRHNGYGTKLVEFCKAKVVEYGKNKLTIGIIEENKKLKEWYASHGFKHTGTRVFEHLPFTVGYMEWVR